MVTLNNYIIIIKINKYNIRIHIRMIYKKTNRVGDLVG